MSIECSECERDLRGGHDPSCSRIQAVMMDLIERQALEIARLKVRWNDATQMTREDIRRQALEEAAQVIDGRVRNERNRAEQHKAAGKHYKAREAAHVARIAEQDAARIRALATQEDRNDG